MPFLLPNQQRQSTEGIRNKHIIYTTIYCTETMLVSNNFTGKLSKACETKHGPTCVAEPADIYRVEADEIFQVKQNGRQAVELVGKPEVREPNVVKRRRKNSKLQQ